jgi:hypothetical protein
MIFVAMVLAFIIHNERVIAEYFEPAYRYGGIAGRYVDTMAVIYLLRYTPTVYVADFVRFDSRNRWHLLLCRIGVEPLGNDCFE